MSAANTLKFINTIKKEKSFEMKFSKKNKVNILVTPIERYIIATRMIKS